MAGQIMSLGNSKKGVLVTAKNWAEIKENLAGNGSSKWVDALGDFEDVDTSDISIYKGKADTYGALVELEIGYRWMSITDLLAKGAAIETKKGLEIVPGTISREDGTLIFSK